MAVNTTEIGTVYDTLITKAESTLTTMFDRYDLSGTERATVLSNVIVNAQSLSVSSVQQQELNESQIDANIANIALTERNTALTEANIEKVAEEIDVLQSQDLEIIANTTRQNNLANAQVANTERNTALTESQIESLGISDTLKTNMTNADIDVKNAQKAVTERQASKVEAEIESVQDENTRRNTMNTKDLQVKDAQKTLTYREAMLKEQQQRLLANQTAYEAEKTTTLENNTKANMLIRTIDGGVDEVNSYLNSVGYSPSVLNNVIAQARYDLLELSGVDISDYTTAIESYVFTIEGTDNGGDGTATAHTKVTRGLDGATYLLTGDYDFLAGDKVSYIDTNDGTGTGIYQADIAVNTANISTLDLSTNWTKL